MRPVPAALAFFALGVVTFATVALLLLSPRHREVRWFAVFSLSVMTWLLGLGLVLLRIGGDTAGNIAMAGVALMPALFVAMAVSKDGTEQRWRPWAAASVGAVALALVLLAGAGVTTLEPTIRPVLLSLHIVGWTTGVTQLVRDERRRGQMPLRGRIGARTVVVAIAATTPILVVIAQLIGVEDILITAVPAFVVMTYIAVFVGAARLRFYDIEVRATRSGALAAETAETARMTALGEMAASFAHEVRNPLTGVRSLAQRLAEDDVDEVKRRRYAGVILDEVARVERIVEHLLGVSRHSRGARTTAATPLDSLFDDIALLTTVRARRSGVRIETAGGGLIANAPREALAQALLNLVLNAIAHSPVAGGIRIAAAPAENGIAITVTDEGPGVPPAERERIFEPFYSARPDGAGLGLSVVRTLARELGWTVTVEDLERCGAAFRLHVPARGSDTEPAGLPHAQAASAHATPEGAA